LMDDDDPRIPSRREEVESRRDPDKDRDKPT